ncbi:MAG: SpoIIE family protein phosphatase [Salinibacterium sp.]|nr:SpoIIE family protein phosphatase [Salinibacterium sp.]
MPNSRDMGEWSLAIKQIPIGLLLLGAAIMTVALEALPISNLPMFIASGVVMFVSTFMAVGFRRTRGLRRFETSVIVLDFVAIAAFRYATGESSSIFGVMLILPLIWMASLDGRRHIVWAALGGGVVVLLHIPINAVINNESPATMDVVRALFSPVVYALTAAVINDMARRARINLTRSYSRELASSEELLRAAAVQRALLPKNERLLEGYQLSGSCVPSRSVGGDFFDWYEIDGGLAITMGDVMGKGVGAGMVAATARAVVRGAASDPDPTTALEQVAACFDNELGDASTFLTLFHARLNSSGGYLDYVDAGHGLTLLVHPDGTYYRMASSDYPVGIVSNERWTKKRIELAPGDTLVCFSDGVLDLYDGTLAAVDEIVRITGAAPSAKAVTEALSDIAREQQNDDDVTIVVLRRDLVVTHNNKIDQLA